MARCSLADGRCGRLGTPCRSGQCAARRIRRLHDRRWRDKLGLFFVEGEDAVAAATADPVDLLRAGEDVEPRLLAEVISDTPAMAPSARSSGVATVAAMVSGLAPGMEARTEMVG